MILALASLMLGATIGIHVEVAEGMTPADLAILTGELERSIAERTQAKVATDRPPPSPCGGRADCLDAIRKRTGADELVLVRLYAAVTRIGLFLERRSPGVPVVETRADLALASEAWHADLSAPLAALFPPAAQVEVPEPQVQAAAAPDPFSPPPPTVTKQVRGDPPVLSYVAMATGGALLATGVLVWISGQNALSNLQSRINARDADGKVTMLSLADANASYDSINFRRNLAVITGGVGLAAGAFGAIYYFLGPRTLPSTGVSVGPGPTAQVSVHF